jgi:hypothetical protein
MNIPIFQPLTFANLTPEIKAELPILPDVIGIFSFKS